MLTKTTLFPFSFYWCPIKVFQEQYQSQRDCLVVAGFSHAVDKPGNVFEKISF